MEVVLVVRCGFDDCVFYAGGDIDMSSRSSVRFLRPILFGLPYGLTDATLLRELGGLSNATQKDESEVTTATTTVDSKPTETGCEVQVDG